MSAIPGKFEDVRFKLLLAYFAEDAGRGDITTESLGIDKKCKAEVFAKSPCITAGISAISLMLEYFNIDYTIMKNDGEHCRGGEVILKLEGDGAAILKFERLMLNVIGRMSGIATVTRTLVDKVKKMNPNCIIAATRKTTPGFRVFEKDAVMLGGGHPHRYDLDEAVMIKDNHLKFVKEPEDALRRAADHIGKMKDKTPTRLKYGEGEPKHKHKWIEIEADTRSIAVAAASSGADIIMLDNMSPEEAEKTYKEVKSINSDVKIEISGGITPDNIMDYANSADIISLGWLTHSSPALDFSLDIIEVL